MKRRTFLAALPLAAPLLAKGFPMHISPWQPPHDTNGIAHLRARLAATRWCDAVGADWVYGTAQAPLRQLLQYWQSGYDWAQARARNAALPHYRAGIDGAAIHFLHYRGRGPAPRPLLLMNGWPSSFVEYAKLAPLLADPGAHGGDARDAFDVIIPAHPGFGYSDRPTAPGRSDSVDLFYRLMTQGLGYERFIAAGTDIGAGVATRMALRYPRALEGIHISALTDPPAQAGSAPPNEAEQAYLDAVTRWRDEEGAYLHLQATRPQTLAHALNDSPAGLASWLLDKFHGWGDLDGADLFEAFPMQMLADNLTLYWSTQTIASSMRYYHEARHLRAPLAPGARVTTPTAVCMWPKDLVVGPRDWAERFYNVVQYGVQARGGHFPAWERPLDYAGDIRKFGRSLPPLS